MSEVALYHNALSTCSQKVRLALAEKGVAFASHEIDLIAGGQHDAEYVKLNPKHVVPTLLHDGQVLVESSLIIRYVDDAFDGPPLQPTTAYGRYVDGTWIRRIDDHVHPAAPVITFAIGGRPVVMAQPEEVREANIAAMPSALARATRRSVLAHGVDAPEFAGALATFLDMLGALEADLAQRGWLSGDAPGLADATVLPYVLRLEHMAMDPLLASERRPRVADWLARWKARESFATAVDAWLPEPVKQLFRGHGEAVWKDVDRVVADLERA